MLLHVCLFTYLLIQSPRRKLKINIYRSYQHTKLLVNNFYYFQTTWNIKKYNLVDYEQQKCKS